MKIDVVGSYESIDIIHCDACGKDEIRVHRYVENTEAWKATFAPHVPWACPSCGEEDYYPQQNMGIRFICPGCNRESVSAREPTRVSQEEGTRFFVYHDRTTTCMHCEEEFGMGTSFGEDVEMIDPSAWTKILYRTSSPEQGATDASATGS
jgi:hypothetical protein